MRPAITVVVEGDTDIPIVRRLVASVGLDAREPVVDTGGKAALDRKLAGYARAGEHAPFAVVRDLDHDADCAPSWLAARAPAHQGGLFTLRLAVRAIEAWVLADATALGAALGVSPHLVPLCPDDEHDPKRTIVALARRSRRAEVRRALVPAEGAARKAGAGYEGWLIAFGEEAWSVDRATKRSPSLARAQAALQRVAERVMGGRA